MAFIYSRKVSIRWKLNPDVFGMLNKDVMEEVTRKFGSTITAVNTMLVKKELLETTMPIILGINPTDDGWQKELSNYWNSLSVDIPKNGKDLEIGFSFDLSDKDRTKYIKEIVAKKAIKTDEDLANAVMSSKEIPEDELYRYGAPIKAEDYVLFIYSKNYRDVANKVEDVDKSSYIRFYIHDNEIQKRQKEAASKIAMKAQEKYIDLVKSKDSADKILNILCILQPNEIESVEVLTNDERQVRLFDMVMTNTNEFINACDNTNLHTLALIEKLLSKRIIRKMPNTSVIVDIEDPSLIIGNTTTEAISWFALDKNSAKVNEYIIRLKSQK